MISRDDIEAFAETDEQKDYWNIPKGMIYIFDVDGTLTCLLYTSDAADE